MTNSRAICGALLAAALLLLAACGGGSDTPYIDPNGTPLSLGKGSPRAYTEAKLSGRHGARLRFQHLAIVRLEAAGKLLGDSAGEGIDRVVYQVDRPLTLELGIDGSASSLRRLVVRDAAGRELARLDRGAAATSIQLAPGAYAIELIHMQAGDASAAAQLIFLQPGLGTRLTSDGSDSRRLIASARCDGCDFGNSDLQGEDWSGVQATGCNFGNTSLKDAKFIGANLRGCLFWTYTGTASFNYRTDLSGADFSGARLDDAQLLGVSGDRAVFTGATLTGTTWGAVRLDRVLNGWGFSVNLTNASFANAILKNADLRGATISGSDFRGADLEGAKLGSPGPFQPPVFCCSNVSNFTGSTFAKNPVSGRATNFSGADFSGGSFVGLDFSDANFNNATVTGAVFDAADVSGATLTGLHPLIFPAFNKAKLAQVDFTGVYLAPADLSQVSLSLTQIAQATLTNDAGLGTDLTGQVFPKQFKLFKGKDLRYVNLSGVSLSQADLQGTKLDGALLRGANLNYTNLKGASMQGAQLGVTPDSGLPVAGLVGAYMPDVDLTDADLRSADLSGAHIYNATGQVKLVRTQLTWANLSNAILAGALIGGSAKNTVFNGAVMVNVIFNQADLSDAKFDSAYLQGTDFSGATSVAGVSLVNAAVSTAPGGWSYTEQDGSPQVFGYQATNLGAIATTKSTYCPSSETGPCTGDKLMPSKPPYPAQPACIPLPPNYDNCLPPAPPS